MAKLHLILGYPFRDQIKSQGFKVIVPDRLEALEDIGFGLLRAHHHGILTERELKAAHSKLTKKVSRYVSQG